MEKPPQSNEQQRESEFDRESLVHAKVLGLKYTPQQEMGRLPLEELGKSIPHTIKPKLGGGQAYLRGGWRKPVEAVVYNPSHLILMVEVGGVPRRLFIERSIRNALGINSIRKEILVQLEERVPEAVHLIQRVSGQGKAYYEITEDDMRAWIQPIRDTIEAKREAKHENEFGIYLRKIKRTCEYIETLLSQFPPDDSSVAELLEKEDWNIIKHVSRDSFSTFREATRISDNAYAIVDKLGALRDLRRKNKNQTSV